MSQQGNEGPLSLKTKLADLLTTAQLERYVNVAGNQVRRRCRCPVIGNEQDPELACKVYEEFVDIATDHRLSLDTGPLKFEYFRQCLAGQARSAWDAAAAAQGGTTNANFQAAIVEWFTGHFDPTAYHDQKEYLLGATKAHSMTVKETATRVEEIIRFMRFMPGAPAAGAPVYSDVEKKMVLYRLMRNNWKTNFDASGNDITDAGYTWNNLVTYMTAQEKKENRNSGRMVPGGRSHGGRGFGRGRGRSGRGRGYSSYGSMRRAADSQGGRPSVRFRPNNYGYGGQGYLPPPYGRGYPQGLARGYDYGGRGYTPGYSGGGYIPRAPVAPYGHGRGRGRGFAGRGRGGNRESRSLQGDPGYAHRPGRSTRSGGTYNIETDGSGNNGGTQPESFDSGETQESDANAGHAQGPDMFYGDEGAAEGGDEGYDPYEDFGYGYEEEYGGFGDY